MWFADTGHKNRCEARKKRKMEFVDRDDSKIDHGRRFDAVCATVRTLKWACTPVREQGYSAAKVGMASESKGLNF
eukprot:COSAG02_NODE_153_length_33128_cov_10.471253_22_plen_75_part_00